MARQASRDGEAAVLRHWPYFLPSEYNCLVLVLGKTICVSRRFGHFLLPSIIFLLIFNRRSSIELNVVTFVNSVLSCEIEQFYLPPDRCNSVYAMLYVAGLH